MFNKNIDYVLIDEFWLLSLHDRINSSLGNPDYKTNDKLQKYINWGWIYYDDEINRKHYISTPHYEESFEGLIQRHMGNKIEDSFLYPLSNYYNHCSVEVPFNNPNYDFLTIIEEQMVFPLNIETILASKHHKTQDGINCWLMLGKLNNSWNLSSKSNKFKYFFYYAYCEEDFLLNGYVKLYTCDDYQTLVDRIIDDDNKILLGIKS